MVGLDDQKPRDFLWFLAVEIKHLEIPMGFAPPQKDEPRRSNIEGMPMLPPQESRKARIL